MITWHARNMPLQIFELENQFHGGVTSIYNYAQQKVNCSENYSTLSYKMLFFRFQVCIISRIKITFCKLFLSLLPVDNVCYPYYTINLSRNSFPILKYNNKLYMIQIIL